MKEVDPKDFVAFVAGAAFGAGVMYVLDPDAGSRRRSLARDQMSRARSKTREATTATARDLLKRSYGFMAEARSRLFEGHVEDDVLALRVRAKLGYLVRNPSSIDVRVDGGRVVLSGPVRADEVDQLIEEIASVRGVNTVENRLDAHEGAGSLPSLQGDKPRPSPQRLDLFKGRWSPATRVLVVASSAAILYAITRPNFIWPTLVSLGLASYASTGVDRGRALISRPAKGKRLNALYDRLSTGWSS